MIEVEGLRFTYPGQPAPAVHDLTFTVERGSIFGFLGPSGAGKSTVQKILTKLLPRQHGAVRFDGKDLDGLDRSFFRRIGVSFEHPNLFPRLTGKENLLCFAGLYGEPLLDPGHLLERVGLGADQDKLAGDYSKGMKQRLVLARALLHQPDFLFLDEPTSGLDPTTIRSIVELVREQRERGATIFLCTHNMVVADQLCDRLAFLYQGHIVAEGAPRDLKLEHGQRSIRVERRREGQLVQELFRLHKDDEREALAALVQSGACETVHSMEASLEEIFVELTGRGLS